MFVSFNVSSFKMSLNIQFFIFQREFHFQSEMLCSFILFFLIACKYFDSITILFNILCKIFISNVKTVEYNRIRKQIIGTLTIWILFRPCRHLISTHYRASFHFRNVEVHHTNTSKYKFCSNFNRVNHSVRSWMKMNDLNFVEGPNGQHMIWLTFCYHLNMLCSNQVRTHNRCKHKLKITIIRHKPHFRTRYIRKFWYHPDNRRRNRTIAILWTIMTISAIVNINMCLHRRCILAWVLM